VDDLVGSSDETHRILVNVYLAREAIFAQVMKGLENYRAGHDNCDLFLV